MMTNRISLLWGSLFVFLFYGANISEAANVDHLPALGTVLSETSVSGISSGGFFAVQMQVAFSSIMKGAGVVAGGPYHCAAEHLAVYCMTTTSPWIGGTPGLARTKSYASSHEIDDPAHMASHRVYLLSGAHDTVVSRHVVDQLYKYYVTDGHFVPQANVRYNTELPSGHTFPTDFESVSGLSSCTSSSSPYVSNCAFDGAGAILSHIYGNLTERTTHPTGKWLEFDQREFSSGLGSTGLAESGYVYIPAACAAGGSSHGRCRVHVAFHGCAQSHGFVGDRFTHGTGYDRWADHNRLVVLFPQTLADLMPRLTVFNGWLNNLSGCWDWLGWYGTNYATKAGPQMAAVRRMIDRLAAPA